MVACSWLGSFRLDSIQNDRQQLWLTLPHQRLTHRHMCVFVSVCVCVCACGSAAAQAVRAMGHTNAFINRHNPKSLKRLVIYKSNRAETTLGHTQSDRAQLATQLPVMHDT